MENEEKLNFGTIWAVGAAALISSAISFAFLLQQHGLAANLAAGLIPEALGGLFFHFAIVCSIVSTMMWAVLHFGFVRWVAPYRTSTFFLIVWGATVVTNGALAGLGYWWLKQDVAHSQAEMSRAQAELATAFDANGAPRDMRVRSTGEAGEIVRLIKNYAAANARAAGVYQKSVLALDYPAFVQPARLAADRGFKLTRAKLKQGHAAVKAYREQLSASNNALKAALKTAKFSGSLRSGVLDGFREMTAAAGDRRALVLASEDAIFAEYEYLLDDLSHAKGRWLASGKTMTFTNQRDLEIFNDHMANLRGYAQAEQQPAR